MALIDNLVAFYELEESSGAAVDAHSTNDLTEGGTTVGTATGNVNNGRVFNASTDQLASGTLDAALTTGSITFWVKPDSVTNDQYILDHDPGNARACLLGFQDGHYNLFNGVSYPTGNAADTQMAATGAGSWDMVTWTFDASTLKGYVNASLIVNVSATVNASRPAFLIGHPFTSGSNAFAGVLDQVGFWNRVLTGDDVTALYNGGSGLTYAQIVSGGAGGAGQPTMRRWGGVPGMTPGGGMGRTWGRTKDSLIVPRRFAD